MSIETGLTRLGRAWGWFIRLPPKARWVLAAVAAVVGVVLVVTGLWPIVIVIAVLFFGRSSKEAAGSKGLVEQSRRKALADASARTLQLAARAEAGRPASAAPSEALRRATEAVRLEAARAKFRQTPAPRAAAGQATPPAGAPRSMRPIVEDGDSFWGRRRSRSGAIVE